MHSFHIAVAWYIPANYMNKYINSGFQTHIVIHLDLFLCFSVAKIIRLEGQFQKQRIFRAVSLLKE